MATEIKTPDMGEAIESAKLVTWLKNEGESVKSGEAICEVETDKATTEVESDTDGVLLRQLVAAGGEVKPGKAVAYIGEPGESIPQP